MVSIPAHKTAAVGRNLVAPAVCRRLGLDTDSVDHSPEPEALDESREKHVEPVGAENTPVVEADTPAAEEQDSRVEDMGQGVEVDTAREPGEVVGSRVDTGAGEAVRIGHSPDRHLVLVVVGTAHILAEAADTVQAADRGADTARVEDTVLAAEVEHIRYSPGNLVEAVAVPGRLQDVVEVREDGRDRLPDAAEVVGRTPDMHPDVAAAVPDRDKHPDAAAEVVGAPQEAEVPGGHTDPAVLEAQDSPRVIPAELRSPGSHLPCQSCAYMVGLAPEDPALGLRPPPVSPSLRFHCC